MKTTKLKISACIRFLAGLSVFACASVARAAESSTWLDTDFENGTVSGWASYQVSAPSTGTITTEQVGDEGNNSYLKVSSTTGFRGVYHLLPQSVTLAQGDTLSVSFRLMFTATGTNVRFGLFKYAGGEQDNTSDQGYFTGVSEGGAAPTGLTRDVDSGSNDPCSGSSNNNIGGTTMSAETAFATDIWYDASFTLTVISKPETGNTSIQITATVGGSSITATRNGANYFDFGMFYIGSGNNNARFAIDDVLVTSNIPAPVPEPAACAALVGLAALGCAALAVRRRHRRQA
ncbi:hypothetical protein OpiT1DRAFT_01634 [Opitutaceae bacterium TAV1]|nr:hypothetical protein OpiT1DRAFT_01634 [Opitutaceae bacterium TAV1]